MTVLALPELLKTCGNELDETGSHRDSRVGLMPRFFGIKRLECQAVRSFRGERQCKIPRMETRYG